jgi:aspartyl-tRNA(Asn)/glutamyl-tRNA(Gln) amidotransferase subunit C
VAKRERIDLAEVLKVARLARLSLSSEEAEGLRGDLARILDYVAKLEEVDVSGVEPLAHPVPLEMLLREVSPGELEADEALAREDLLANAPDEDGQTFRVPPVLGET